MKQEPTAVPVTPSPTRNPWVDRQLEAMSLEQKVGQLMMIGFDGTSVTPELRATMRDLHAGGIIVFERNVDSPAALARLVAGAQMDAAANGDPYLFVGIDQEGGTVARLKELRGFTEIPSMMAVGATGDVDSARKVAAVVADELNALGINMNFAPVLDVNNNPSNPVIAQRSFGSDPQRVAEFGAAYIEALQSRGVLAVGKHFPGHGDTDVDSHANLPSVTHDTARLEAVELLPFKAAMRSNVAGIMSAHVTFPAVDATQGLAGTLSPKVMTGLLREELGYTGLSFTDALDMGALATTGYPVPLAAATALKAGADVLLFNHGYDDHRKAHALIMDWVKRGDIPITRLNEAVRRVLSAKAALQVAREGKVSDPAAVGSTQNKAVARAVAQRAITVVRDQAGLLPLARPALVIETPGAGGLGIALDAERILSAAAQPRNAQIRNLVAQAKRAKGTVVVGTTDVAKSPQQAELVNALLDEKIPLVVVAARSPYDLAQFSRAPTYVATYGASPLMFWALHEVLTGRFPALGKLPVELPPAP